MSPSLRSFAIVGYLSSSSAHFHTMALLGLVSTSSSVNFLSSFWSDKRKKPISKLETQYNYMIYIHITRSFIFIHYQCYITYLQFLGQPIMHQPITSSMELSLQSLGRTHIPSLEYSKNAACYTVDIVLANIVSFLSIRRLKNSFYGIKICTYCIPLLKVNKKYC